MNIFKKSIIKYIGALLIFSLASIYITYPLVLHLGDYITAFGDELLIAWIHSWVIHAIISGNILSIFEANIYYPYHHTLAYSDTHFISSIISMIPVLLIGQPIVANNFGMIFSLAMLGFSLYALCFYLTKNYLAALLSGILVVFSPSTLSHYIHIQMLAIYFVPFAILFFLKFLDLHRTKFLLISLLFFVVQTYNSFLPGYFTLFSYLIIFLFYFLKEKKKAKKLLTKRNSLFFALALCMLIPLMIPYYSVSKEFNYVRDIRDTIHLALQPEDMLYASGFSRLSPLLNNLSFNRISQNSEFKPGFIGLIFTLLTFYAVYYFFKNFKKTDRIIKSFFFIALTGIVLSLGPVLHLGRHTLHNPVIPLPYGLFYYLFPGFQGLRNSFRWEMLFVLGMAVVVSLVLHQIFKTYSLKKQIIIYSVLLIGCVVEFNFPMHFEKIQQTKDFPKVYAWLATTPEQTTIIEFPIYVWYMHPYVFDENMREYYATMHFRKMVNGASGFSPPPWQKMALQLQKGFPSKETITTLKEMKVNYIIIHKSEYDRLFKDNYKLGEVSFPEGDKLIKEIANTYKLKLIKRIDEDYVYKI